MAQFVFFPELRLSMNLDNIDEVSFYRETDTCFLNFAKLDASFVLQSVKLIQLTGKDPEKDAMDFLELVSSRPNGFIFNIKPSTPEKLDAFVLGNPRRDNRF